MKNIILYKHSRFIQLGTKNKLKNYFYKNKNITPYESDFVQPKSIYWKRQSNKRVRKANCYNGMYYKKLYGWFEWS